MPELNVVTAGVVGIFAAAIWSVVAVQRTLRAARFATVPSARRTWVWVAAGLSFAPALLLAFGCALALTRLTVGPGAWNHLSLALTVALGVGGFGALFTWLGALACASLLRRRHVEL